MSVHQTDCCQRTTSSCVVTAPEIPSPTGEHAIWFASRFVGLLSALTSLLLWCSACWRRGWYVQIHTVVTPTETGLLRNTSSHAVKQSHLHETTSPWFYRMRVQLPVCRRSLASTCFRQRLSAEKIYSSLTQPPIFNRLIQRTPKSGWVTSIITLWEPWTANAKVTFQLGYAYLSYRSIDLSFLLLFFTTHPFIHNYPRYAAVVCVVRWRAAEVWRHEHELQT